MRRWLAVFLLLLLPLQLAWAVAAPYCAHEATAADGKHPGHHQHVHQGGDAAAADAGSVHDADGDVGGGANHPDCASCHAGAAATLPPPATALAGSARDVMREQAIPRYRSPTPAAPERPDIA